MISLQKIKYFDENNKSLGFLDNGNPSLSKKSLTNSQVL